MIKAAPAVRLPQVIALLVKMNTSWMVLLVYKHAVDPNMEIPTIINVNLAAASAINALEVLIKNVHRALVGIS